MPESKPNKFDEVHFLIHPLFGYAAPGYENDEYYRELYRTYSTKIGALARKKNRLLVILAPPGRETVLDTPRPPEAAKYYDRLLRLATEQFGRGRILIYSGNVNDVEMKELKNRMKDNSKLFFMGEHRMRCLLQALFKYPTELGVSPAELKKRVKINFAHSVYREGLPSKYHLNEPNRRKWFKQEKLERKDELSRYAIQYSKYYELREKRGFNHLTALESSHDWMSRWHPIITRRTENTAKKREPQPRITKRK